MNKIFITCKESKIENNHSFYGSFYIGPFNEAQSLTMANALRRSLLSDCVGLGMTSVIIENVSHEYSTLPGVRDSVLDILLNLKEIVLKKKPNLWQIYKKKGFSSLYEEVGTSFLNPFVGYLKIRGPGIIRAKDLCLPPFIQCVDPNQYIATLAHDGCLNMKFVITEGKGYKVQKSNKDLNFSLVKKRQELINDLIEIQPVIDERKSELEQDSLLSDSLELSQHLSGPADIRLKIGRLLAKQGDTQPSFTLQTEAHIGENKKKRVSNFPKLAVFNKNHPFFGENLNKKDYIGGTAFKSATQLFLDTVFNPVTKVNYIIEAIESKSLTNNHIKSSLVDDLTNFLETSNMCKTNFPLKKLSTRDKTQKKKKTLKNINVSFSAKHEFTSLSPLTTARTQKQHKKIIEIMNRYLDFELNIFSTSLHPLKNNDSLHNIILEIWTNGSLHPRDALSLAFQNLSFLFLNMQKTKVYNPFFYEASSYNELKNSF